MVVIPGEPVQVDAPIMVTGTARKNIPAPVNSVVQIRRRVRSLVMTPRARPGTTVTELMVAMLVMGALLGMAMPRFRDATDRAAARAAVQEAASLFSFARRAAVTRRSAVGVIIDTAAGAVIVRIGALQLGQVRLRERYGVQVTASRDSMAYDPRGLGHGAANLTIVARRGRGVETLFVSRLGRTRR